MCFSCTDLPQLREMRPRNLTVLMIVATYLLSYTLTFGELLVTPGCHVELLPSIPHLEKITIKTVFPMPDPIIGPEDDYISCKIKNSTACALRNATILLHSTVNEYIAAIPGALEWSSGKHHSKKNRPRRFLGLSTITSALGSLVEKALPH